MQLHWAGSEARLYLDDTLAADTYYIDGVWDIGLSRFDIKGDTDVRLEITAYREGDDIFFDCRPSWKTAWPAASNKRSFLQNIKSTFLS